jgi:aerobic-type carbon monoxide dehydrogenase small subunit (CoxS/CutS family)
MTTVPTDDLQQVTLSVNGSERTIAVPTHRTLLDGLRDEVGLPARRAAAPRASAAPAPFSWTARR